MWQRFTERARRVVFFAQEEAGRQGENYVGTEHLLLGLVREDDSVAARILIKMDISLDSIREAVQAQVTQGVGLTGKDMQLTQRAKRAIDLAYDEARRLDNNYIGTEHLLLGLIREVESTTGMVGKALARLGEDLESDVEGTAGKILASLGVDLERTREEIRQLQNQAVSGSSGSSPSSAPSATSGAAETAATPAEPAVEPNPRKGDIGVLRRDPAAQVQLVLERADVKAYEEVMETKDDYAYREMVEAGKVILLAPGTQAKFLRKEEPNSDYVRVLDGEHAGKCGYVRRGTLQETHADDRPFPGDLTP